MTSFTREQKKVGRRNAQARKVEAKAEEDASYFWECVRSEERKKATGKSLKTHIDKSTLFGRQGTSGINFDQYDAIPVSRSGPPSQDIPEVENFLDLQSVIPSFLHSNLTHPDKMNYTSPTPIQRHCVPLSLSGKYDVMACAQTGSGKTVAFLVPLIAHISSNSSKSALNSKSSNAPRVTPAAPIALVVAPTRELALQIELETHKLTFTSPLHCVCVYGGSPTRSQLALLAKGVDILVATPGRLNDFLQRELITLRNTRFLVLDEADRMLDMGFEPQIRQICERYDLPAASARRTLMFSATFPDEVQRIAQKYMRRYVFVAVGRVGSTIESITQKLVCAPVNDKRRKLGILLPLINPQERTLVFCQKKHVAQWLRGQITKELAAAGVQVRVDAIHGDRSQSQRESALKGFREGSVDILVATDVAARGLDVPEISHVIQFDLPVSKEDFDSYVHRIGRTGRAGRLGVATSLYVPGLDGKAGQNGALWAPLHTLLVEGNQEVPEWFLSCGGGGGNGAISRQQQQQQHVHGGQSGSDEKDTKKKKKPNAPAKPQQDIRARKPPTGNKGAATSSAHTTTTTSVAVPAKAAAHSGNDFRQGKSDQRAQTAPAHSGRGGKKPPPPSKTTASPPAEGTGPRMGGESKGKKRAPQTESAPPPASTAKNPKSDQPPQRSDNKKARPATVPTNTICGESDRNVPKSTAAPPKIGTGRVVKASSAPPDITPTLDGASGAGQSNKSSSSKRRRGRGTGSARAEQSA